jgi:hypothetical protein
MLPPDLPVTSTGGDGDNGGVDKALEILEQVTSIRVVGEFLKRRGLPFSAGSWVELRDKRIMPSLDNGSLTAVDLIGLVGELEEYGRSHVFLYMCKKYVASRLLEEESIIATAQMNKLHERLNSAIVLNQPASPTITEIRYGGAGPARFLVVKVIERRQHRKYLGENLEGNRITKEWEVQLTRAVNVVRLSPSGLLEIRIQSHINSSQYKEDVTRIWSTVSPFFPIDDFQTFSLSRAKQTLWENREELKERLRYSDSRMRNDFGNTVVAATGNSQSDLFEDDGLKNSLNVFLKSGAYCDSSNIWWIIQEDGVPSTDLHVLLSGMDNEFAVTANCSREDYEYVLSQLKKASQQIS